MDKIIFIVLCVLVFLWGLKDYKYFKKRAKIKNSDQKEKNFDINNKTRSEIMMLVAVLFLLVIIIKFFF